MKIETAGTKQFKPFELVITIDNQAEVDALWDMCLRNTTIPNLVEEKNKFIVEAFLNGARIALIKRT